MRPKLYRTKAKVLNIDCSQVGDKQLVWGFALKIDLENLLTRLEARAQIRNNIWQNLSHLSPTRFRTSHGQNAAPNRNNVSMQNMSTHLEIDKIKNGKISFVRH